MTGQQVQVHWFKLDDYVQEDIQCRVDQIVYPAILLCDVNSKHTIDPAESMHSSNLLRAGSAHYVFHCR